MENSKKKYGRGFWACATTEIFERLSFYLGRSLILIFVVASVAEGGLGLSDITAAKMQANMTAFSYLGGVIGGIIVDRWWGARYTTPIGMVIAGAGYFMGSIATGEGHIWLMILLVSIGLGLYKNGPVIGRVVPKDQLDSAFSIRYTTVNVGAFIGTFALGILYKDVFAKDGVLGFAPCFRIAAVIMVLGAIWFAVNTRYMGEVGKKPFKVEKPEEVKEEKHEKAAPLTTKEKKRMGAIVLVSGFSVIFWVFWYLGYLPLYYHWSEHMNWTIGGWEVPVTWAESLNSVYCIILGPVMSMFWAKLTARPQGDMSLFRKTAIGIGMLALTYITMAVADIVRGDGKASMIWFVVFFFFLTLGEMFFSPLGSSFISKYAPGKYFGVMMSVWGIATFLAGKLYGNVYEFAFGGNFAFTTACFGIAAVAAVAMIVLFALDKKLSALVED